MSWDQKEQVLHIDLYKVPQWLMDECTNGDMYILTCDNMSLRVRHVKVNLDHPITDDILWKLVVRPMTNPLSFYNHVQLVSKTGDWDFNHLHAFRCWKYGGPKF